MAVKGTLNEISIIDLIQFNCQVGETCRLTVENGPQMAQIYFADGTIIHTTLGDQEGKEVFNEILGWDSGEFELDRGFASPSQTINTNCSDLLLGGLHHLDENSNLEQLSEDELSELDSSEAVGELFGFIHEPPADEDLQEKKEKVNYPEIQEEQVNKQENKKMATKKRSEILDEQLQKLISESSDINSAVIVGYDGLVMASNLSLGHDASHVGAEGAALSGLSSRTLNTLNCGDFQVAILQGTSGWVVAAGAGPKAMVLGLTSDKVNMGMALLEIRGISKEIFATLS